MRHPLSAIAFLITAACFSSAKAQQYGDWNVDKDVEGFQVATTRSGSNRTGIICAIASGNCTAYISIDGLCTRDGLRIPMLVNSGVGSASVVGTCQAIGNLWLINITEFLVARSAMESGGEIGFAIPLNSGQFRVVRFSTTGGALAIRDAMSKPATNTPKAKDQIM